MTFSFQHSKDIVLRAAYDTLLFHAEYDAFPAREVHERLKEHFGAGFVMRILQLLAKEKLIDVEQFDETSQPTYTLSESGFEYVEKLPSLIDLMDRRSSLNVREQRIPASDRIVSIDHNRPEYEEISQALENAIEQARQTKPNDVSGDAHTSLLLGLEAARKLWDSFELTRIQVEIGIIMAVERAQSLLNTTFELVKGPLLVEAIKAFVKSATDGDIL